MKKLLTLGVMVVTLTASGLTKADDITATVVAGHPDVFRWVKMVDQAFAPAVSAALEGTSHSFTVDGVWRRDCKSRR